MNDRPDLGFELSCEGGTRLAAYRWDSSGPARAAVFMAHGMGEHARRYGRFARALNAAGISLFAFDLRGHGEAARTAGLLGHFADRDGSEQVLADLEAMRQHVASELPGTPTLFFGHSMGSLFGQEYLIRHGAQLSGAILSGTGGGQGPLLYAGRAVARIERMRIGPRAQSPVIDRLTFGSYNRGFSPNRTDADWLSRDPAEVDKYVADPLCGATLTTQSWLDFFDTLIGIESYARQKSVPKSLPVFIFAGAKDPVGMKGKGPRWLAKRYERCGLNRVQLKLYSEGRHEMLNEVNRDEVFRDVIGFVESVL